MQIIAIAFLLVGVVIGLVYGIQLVILAFQTSILWGVCYLFVPFAALVFIVKYWDEASYPFLRSLIAIPFYLIGIALLPDSSPML